MNIIKSILRIIRKLIIPLAMMFMIWVPLMRYYASTPWTNACVLEYVDNLEESSYKWYMYDIDWIKHIEPWNSNSVNSLEKYQIWKSNWCLMASDNLFSDMNNTFYCTVSYLIKKAPVKEKFKEPLWILDRE